MKTLTQGFIVAAFAIFGIVSFMSAYNPNAGITLSQFNDSLSRYLAARDTVTTVMTVASATSAISTMNDNINGKVSKTLTHTINGAVLDHVNNNSVTLNTSNIAELTNLYYTNTRARAAISLTTTGTSGAATYNSSTGVLNIPQYASNQSFYNKSGLLSSSSVSFSDTFSVSSATPTISFASYMSAAGKSNFKLTSVTGYRVGATTSNSPNVSVTTLTSNSASFVINQTNTATVTILGINVLSGLPTILVPDPVNIKLLVSAEFY